MSYDINLHRKKGIKEPFYVKDLAVLADLFETKILQIDDQDRVLAFSANYRDSDSEAFKFEYNHEGYYEIYISFGIRGEMFHDFLKSIKDIALLLDVAIVDPQISDDPINPDQYEDYISQSQKRFNYTRNVMSTLTHKFFVPLTQPSTGKYFIKYLITAIHPTTHKKVLWTFDDKQIYCSKVNQEETLGGVIERELPFLIGSHVYEIVDIREGGFAKDRYGNDLPRLDLVIETPYFESKDRKVKYNIVWEELFEKSYVR